MMARRLKYTPKQLQELIDGYFAQTPIEDVTLTGLCLHIGTSRRGLDNYLAREDFREIVTMAKARVEHAYELALRHQGGTANIFALKNFGWKDKQEIDHTHRIEDMLKQIDD